MPLDPTASAALDEPVVKPVFMAFIDFENEPMRVNTSGADIALTGTGDPDIDGFTFEGLKGDLIAVGDIANKGGGTDSVTATISGLVGLDDDMIAELSDPAHWRGREMRLWRIIRNAANVQQGAIEHYYTGNMTAINISASPEGQTIEVTIESYIAAHSEASNRTYLDQEKYDSGDKSAQASIDIANGGGVGSPSTASIVGPYGGGYGNNVIDRALS